MSAWASRTRRTAQEGQNPDSLSRQEQVEHHGAFGISLSNDSCRRISRWQGRQTGMVGVNTEAGFSPHNWQRVINNTVDASLAIRQQLCMMACMVEQLTAQDFARKANVAYQTFRVKAWRERNKIPVPDGRMGHTDWWWSYTVDAWLAMRSTTEQAS